MSFTKVIEFSFSFLVAFVVMTVISFLTLRPALDQALMEARADWSALLRAVVERNDALPGLVEALRGFEPGHGKLAEKILEARSIAVRSTEPETLVAAVNDTDKLLTQLVKLVQAKPNLEQYPPFAAQWKKAVALTQRINYLRKTYSSSVRSYNRLLTAFPQKMVTALFGFGPLNEYAVPPESGLP
jgi:LemA protein